MIKIIRLIAYVGAALAFAAPILYVVKNKPIVPIIPTQSTSLLKTSTQIHL